MVEEKNMKVKKVLTYEVEINGTVYTLTPGEAKELYEDLRALLDVRPAPITTSPYQTAVWYSNGAVPLTYGAAGSVDTITLTSNNDNISINLGE
jgi:hypothetical protein